MQAVSAIALLVLSTAIWTRAQDMQSVGFDATPLSIPSAKETGSESQKAALRPITSMDLLTIRDQKGMAISPDGKRIAFVVGQAVYETNGYRSAVYVVGTEAGSAPVCLGTAGMPRWDIINQWLADPDPPVWSPDGKFVTRIARMSPTATWQVWRWDLSGNHPTQLTHVPGNVQTYKWSSDGTKMSLAMELPSDPRRARQLSEDGLVYDGSFDPSAGRPVVAAALEAQPKATETWVHVLATGEERKQAPTDSDSAPRWVSDIGEDYFDGTTLEHHHLLDAKISPDRRSVAYELFDDSAGAKAVYRLFEKPVRGGTPIDLSPGVHSVEDYWWSADGKKIYYVQDLGNGESGKLMAVPALGGAAQPVFRSEGARASLGYFSPDRNFGYFACERQTRTSPSQIALIDVAAGTVRTLVDLNPEFSNFELGAVTHLEGVNRYGDPWWANLVQPARYEKGKKYPLIVTTYRTREFPRGASGDENPIYVYAANGFAVLDFDMGSRDYNMARAGVDSHASEADRFRFWFQSVEASLDMAIDQVAQTGLIDTSRIGLTGYSRGTEIVAYAITHSKRFRAASGAAGDGSPYSYYVYSAEGQLTFSRLMGGWPGGPAKKNWEELAPDLHAASIDTPILNNDPDSEYLPDLPLYTTLKELGKPMELIIYPDELHWINQPKHRYEIYERNLDWFRFWLKSEESTDPAKVQQHERWRRLREMQAKGQPN